MKLLFYAAGLLALLTACHRANEPAPAPAPDPLLGHWQAETLRILFYDATGKQVDDHTFQRASQLDVTADALTTTQEVNGQPTAATQPYSRAGEVLTLPTAPAQYTYYCRQLTATTFTLEYNEKPVAGQSYTVQLVAYHR